MPTTKKKLLKNPDGVFITALAIIVIAISFFNLAIILAPQQKHYVYAYQEEKPQNQQLVKYWNDFLEENPDYLPGWLQLAKLEMKNDHFSEALLAANQALRIDPNSELVKLTLEQIDAE